MITIAPVNSLTFDSPACYKIRVKGRIKQNWTNRLEGMAIKVDTAEAGTPICTLIGELLDQAALAGVLNTLYTLHLPVVSVEYITEQVVEEQDQPGPQ
jgi:hypothetical protein